MFFNSNEKFLQDITESFERFGIKGESSEKGAVKDTIRIHMVDTIHDSSYIAIAKPKNEKKNADAVWKDIIEKDFVPTATDPKNKGDIPAAAIIVPEADIETVEKILKSKGLRPTVYQIFPGYIVAGLKRVDVGKLVNDFQKTPTNNENNTDDRTKGQEREDHPISFDDTSQALNNRRREPDFSQDENQENSDDIKDTGKKRPFSLGVKVAAAALLGVGAGIIPFAAKTILDKNNVEIPNTEQVGETATVAKVPGINAEKYFESLKEGNPSDMELLKSIASNPSLSKEYIDKLANSPVGVDTVKNPSADSYIVSHAATSPNEDLRAAAAQNPSSRPEDLFRLSSDPSAKVRAGLAKNPAISSDIMKKLANDEKAIKEALLENPSLTPDIFDMVTNNTQPDCEFVRKMMANPCITPDILRRNSVNADECVRLGVAANPGSPQRVLEELSRDKNTHVARNAYANPNISAEKLDALFPPDWANKKDSSAQNVLRKGALENPKLRKAFMEEALAAAPMEYAENLAKNPSIPARIADEINRIAQGRKGLRNFMNEAVKLKADKDFHNNLKTESMKYGGDISVPLRKKLNADFADSVYDPARFASIINAMNRRRSPTGMPISGQAIGGDSEKVSSLDNQGNAPIFFSKKNSGVGAGSGSGGGGGSGGDSSGKGGDRGGNRDSSGEVALSTADDIVSDMMSDILPPVSKSIYGSSTPPAVKQANSFNQGNSSPWRGMDGSNVSLFRGEQPMDLMFKNACDRIDAMQVLF